MPLEDFGVTAAIRYLNTIGHGIIMPDIDDPFNYFRTYKEITSFDTVKYIYTNKFYNGLGITEVVQTLNRADDHVTIKFFAGDTLVVSGTGTMSDLGKWNDNDVEHIMDLIAPWADNYGIIGTQHDDTLRSNIWSGNDLSGMSGNDTLIGSQAAENIAGGAGNDKIFGDYGDDILSGGRGRDSIFGGDDDDIITGGSGRDRLHGDDGNDTIDGGDGNDIIYGGSDDPYGDDRDTLSGGSGNDRIYGGADRDIIDGGDGNDYIYGGEGNDVMTGGAGADVFYFKREGWSSDRDTITDFDPTEDTLKFGNGIKEKHFTITDTDAGARIVFDGPTYAKQVLTLEGVTVADLEEHSPLLF